MRERKEEIIFKVSFVEWEKALGYTQNEDWERPPSMGTVLAESQVASVEVQHTASAKHCPRSQPISWSRSVHTEAAGDKKAHQNPDGMDGRNRSKVSSLFALGWHSAVCLAHCVVSHLLLQK